MTFNPDFVDSDKWEQHIDEVSAPQDIDDVDKVTQNKALTDCKNDIFKLHTSVIALRKQLVASFKADSSEFKLKSKQQLETLLLLKIPVISDKLDQCLIWHQTNQVQPNYRICTELETNLTILKDTIYKYLHQLDKVKYPPRIWIDGTHRQSFCPCKASYCTK